MKKLLIIALAGAAMLSHAASVYVDITDKEADNILYLAPASTDTITFYVSTNGSAFAADSYTPVLLIAPDRVFRTEDTTIVTGTASGAAASFAATNIVPNTGMDGYDYQLVFRSGGVGAYTYTYPVYGKLHITATPKTVTGSANVQALFGDLTSIQASANVTNGATLTPVYGTYILNGIGGDNDTTNTITLANATSGQSLRLIVNSASTNLITIADSGNAALSGAWLGDNNDVINLIGVGTSWVETGASDN